jgi:hypothetical protein
MLDAMTHICRDSAFCRAVPNSRSESRTDDHHLPLQSSQCPILTPNPPGFRSLPASCRTRQIVVVATPKRLASAVPVKAEVVKFDDNITLEVRFTISASNTSTKWLQCGPLASGSRRIKHNIHQQWAEFPANSRHVAFTEKRATLNNPQNPRLTFES